ncbi:hypothetical protein OUZ56_033252 [Daphnia magna]|uniref:Uncharacterized protein n=1 Tax=Daphnia magna TaxID=35525 RepID=A0ABQ9ZY70_9CRUS|nr:hypothetical protein OUZ56_033252 [Daphnia magna]
MYRARGSPLQNIPHTVKTAASAPVCSYFIITFFSLLSGGHYGGLNLAQARNLWRNLHEVGHPTLRILRKCENQICVQSVSLWFTDYNSFSPRSVKPHRQKYPIGLPLG